MFIIVVYTSGMPRFDGDEGGFMGGIQTGYDSYFDTRCREDDDSEEDEDDRPGYDRYEDEPSEEKYDNIHQAHRRMKPPKTCKFGLRNKMAWDDE